MRPSFDLRNEMVYLDNAATTKIDPEVLEAMRPYLEERFGNPETSYHIGQEANDAVGQARALVYDLLGESDGSVFFTSGGTEANNWAIKGWQGTGRIAVSAIEHKSVLEPAVWLRSVGDVELVTLPVDENGVVSLEAVGSAMEDGLSFLSVQHANNEVGTIQPIAEIAKMLNGYRYNGQPCLLHVDASQTFGKINVSPSEMGADLVTVSAHKMHGPKGIGALYVRKGVRIDPLLHGGGQQDGMRSGTIPVHLVVGFGRACEAARTSMGVSKMMWEAMAREIEELKIYPGVSVNAEKAPRLPNIISLMFDGIEAALLASILDDRYGICVGRGAACSRNGLSHVLKAMGRTKAESESTIRVSFGRFNSLKDAMVFQAAVQSAKREALEREFV
jgi:cysteine desulfurase